MSRPDSKKSAATIYDVAELAGVSHITVSRVANGKPNVSPKTRQRVLEAMQDLEYVPNQAAQALQTGRANVIELVTPDIWGIGPGAITNILMAAKAQQYQVSILPTPLDNLYNVLGSTSSRFVSGTLLYATSIDLDYRLIGELTQGRPFVQIGGKLHSNLASVTYDQFYAAQLATQHLIDLGHRHIAHLGGPQHMLDGKLRYDGWLRTLRDNGLEPGPCAFGNFGEENIEEPVRSLLESGQPFTAVFVASDHMAIALIYLLGNYGISVPEALSIIGYDNRTLGRYVRPNLTTITNDIEMMSKLAVEYLFQRIENPLAPGHQRVLTPELIVRASTRPPRQS